MTEVKIRQAVPADAADIVNLSCLAFNLSPQSIGESLVPSETWMNHSQRFTDGVFVAEIDSTIVGYALTLRTNRSPQEKALVWKDAIGGMDLNAHETTGQWLYGVDFAVHPHYRKRGIGSALYRARFLMIKRLNLRGFYAGGMLAAYRHHAHELSLEAYVQRVREGSLADPTVSMQMKNGFMPLRAIPDYCGKGAHAMLILWHNPTYQILKPKSKVLLLPKMQAQFSKDFL